MVFRSILASTLDLTPAAVFGQKVRGRWLIQSEIVAIDMGIVRFAELLRQEIATRFGNLEVHIFGDPAGDFRAQTDETLLPNLAWSRPEGHTCTIKFSRFEA